MARGQAAAAALNALRDAEAREREIREQEKWRQRDERLAALQFVGVNVTVPHKFEALSAADEIDDSATKF